MSETTKKAPSKPTRTAKLTRVEGGLALTIRQQRGTQTPQIDVYYVEPTEDGYTLVKHSTERYHIRFEGMEKSCDCQGFTRWKHCKHLESIQALQITGRL